MLIWTNNIPRPYQILLSWLDSPSGPTALYEALLSHSVKHTTLGRIPSASERPVAETSDNITLTTHINAPDGIRTRNPNKCGQWDRPPNNYLSLICSHSAQNMPVHPIETTLNSSIFLDISITAVLLNDQRSSLSRIIYYRRQTHLN